MINNLHKRLTKRKKKKILPKFKRTKKSSSRFPQIFSRKTKKCIPILHVEWGKKSGERREKETGFIRKTNRFPEMEGGGRGVIGGWFSVRRKPRAENALEQGEINVLGRSAPINNGLLTY